MRQGKESQRWMNWKAMHYFGVSTDFLIGRTTMDVQLEYEVVEKARRQAIEILSDMAMRAGQDAQRIQEAIRLLVYMGRDEEIEEGGGAHGG